MPPSKISREEAIDRIAEVFRRHGYDGASLRMISEATGLCRASLYHHFPAGKEEMAREVFTQVNREVAENILGPLRASAEPRERLRRWAAGVGRFYAKGGKNCLLGAMVLSGGSDRFAREVAGAFRAWIDGLTSTLRDGSLPAPEARRRAENAVSKIQGALIVSRGLGNTRHFQRVLAELPNELLPE